MHLQNVSVIFGRFPALVKRTFTVSSLLTTMAATAHAQFRDAAVVNHAPSISATVSGSLQILQPETTSFSGTAEVTAQLRVVGTPKIATTGHAEVGAINSGGGGTQPTGYSINVSGNASIAAVILQSDPVAVPALPAVHASAGTRSVQITAADQQIGDTSTLLNLTLAGQAGEISLPAGAYGDVRAQAGSTLVLGQAGSNIPARYDLRSLSVDANASVALAGPVVVYIANGCSVTGTIGTPDKSGWGLIGVASGDLTITGAGRLYGHVICATGLTSLSGSALLHGGLASDRLTISGSATLEIISDSPPTVTVASPANGRVFAAPASVQLSATAADPDGSVASVAYYDGTQSIGQSSVPPFAVDWSGVAAGIHYVTAVAVDNLGVSTRSSLVTVISDVPPTVSLQTPAAGALFAAPAAVSIGANASDLDGSVTKVEFYQGGLKIGESAAAPFQFNWTGVTAGSYLVTAKAIDNCGLSTTSAPVPIRVDDPPTVSIAAPSAGTAFNAPAAITISASATDADGTVQKVEFFQGGTKIGEADTAPFACTWSNVAAGNYTLTAVATDDVGLTATSAAVAVVVNDSVSAADLQNTPWVGTDDYKRNRILLVRDAIAQANQPVSFYGRVVDQSGQPISGVAVTLGVRSTAEPLPGDSEDIVTPYNVATDANGQFQLGNVKGSLLTVSSLAKDGYEAPNPIPGEYWYSASMGNPLFVPDATKPEVFTMWKLAGAQTLIAKSASAQASYDGTAVYFNLVTGRVVSSGGDLKISVVRTPAVLAPGQSQYDWTATIAAIGGGVVVSSDTFMYLAPADGYQSQINLGFSASDPQWTSVQTVPLYVKSRNGQNFARVYLTIATAPDDKLWAAISLQSYLNSSGSRNLEYNPNQDIQLSQ